MVNNIFGCVRFQVLNHFTRQYNPEDNSEQSICLSVIIALLTCVHW
jgi:hypothetical protein